MTKEQVLGSIDGSPSRVHKSTTVSGTTEIWTYEKSTYLYFDETGILKRIDSPY